MRKFLETSQASNTTSLHEFFGELKKMTEHAARKYHFSGTNAEAFFLHGMDHKDFVAEHLHDYILQTLEHYVHEHHEIARHFAQHVLERCKQVMALHGGKSFEDAQMLHGRVSHIHEKLEQLFEGGEEAGDIFSLLAEGGADFSRIQNPNYSLMDSLHLGHEIVERVKNQSESQKLVMPLPANDNIENFQKTTEFWSGIKSFTRFAILSFHVSPDAFSSHNFLNEDCLQPENKTRILSFLDNLSDKHPEISLYFAKHVLDLCNTLEESEEHKHHALILKQDIQRLSDRISRVVEWKSLQAESVLESTDTTEINKIIEHAHGLLDDMKNGESILTGMFDIDSLFPVRQEVPAFAF